VTKRTVGSLPSVADVVGELRRALAEPDHPRPDGVTGLLWDLHRTNAAQWALEDEARADGATDAAVAAAKRAIDGLNDRRHAHMEAVDDALWTLVEPTPSVPPSTESPAMAFDRLSVLILRIHHTQLAAVEAGDDARDLRRRLPLLLAQLGTLERAIEVLLADVAAGTRRYEPYRSHKLYGS
jgi:hypothetical protein